MEVESEKKVTRSVIPVQELSESDKNEALLQAGKLHFPQQLQIPILRFRDFTNARVGLPVAGRSLALPAMLDLYEAQAAARDSVWEYWNAENLSCELERRNLLSFQGESAVASRQEYLEKPHLGRSLSNESRVRLAEWQKRFFSAARPDVAFVVTNGLSTRAIESHYLGFLDAFLFRAKQRNLFSFGTNSGQQVCFLLLQNGRVALADDVAEILRPRLSIIAVGERPGMTSFDSMGLYFTYAPRSGMQDSERNCISNIRVPGGLEYAKAASHAVYLIEECFRQKLSGVSVKLGEDQHNIPLR